MSKIKILFSLFLVLIIMGCKKGDYYIYSPDKSQVITIKNHGNNRYIIDGKHSSIPNKDYVKLDISNIDPIGDEVIICWRNDDFIWEVVNHGAEVIENRLDTLKFKFNRELPKDKLGIPTMKEHNEKGCVSIDMLYNEVSPKEGAIVE